MNHSTAASLLETAIQYYQDYFKEPFDGEYYVFRHGDVKGKRQELFPRLGASFEPFSSSTLGETIYGPNGFAVALYPFNIRNEAEFFHAAFHELGHYRFKKQNPEITVKQTERAFGRRKLYGYTMLDEMAAESIADFIAGDESVYESEADSQAELIRRLYMSLPGINPEMTQDAIDEKNLYRCGIKIMPGILGQYCAMILTEPRIKNLMRREPTFERGFFACNDKIVIAVEDIIEWVSRYLIENTDFICTEDQLDELGKLLLRLESLR